jgi:hypothetical protein
MSFKLACECLQAARRGPAPPQPVDGRISQHAVEPWNDALVDGRLTRVIDDSRKGVLQDVLGQLAIADSPLEVSQEHPMVLDQGVQLRFRGHGHQYRFRAVSASDSIPSTQRLSPYYTGCNAGEPPALLN